MTWQELILRICDFVEFVSLSAGFGYVLGTLASVSDAERRAWKKWGRCRSARPFSLDVD